MFLDQNEVSLFQKSPLNPLCKNGILLKIPLFSKPNFKAIFLIKHHKTVIPEKVVIFKKIKNYKILAMNLSSDCFVKNFFIPYFDSLCKDSERNWVLTLLSRERTGLSIGQGLALSPMEKYQVFL